MLLAEIKQVFDDSQTAIDQQKFDEASALSQQLSELIDDQMIAPIVQSDGAP